LNPIFHVTNKPGNDGGIFVTSTGIMTESRQQFTRVKTGKNLDRSMNVQGSGEQFLSDIRGDSEVDIAPSFKLNSVYFVHMNDILLKEHGLKKHPR
jgi:hypothetical protein